MTKQDPSRKSLKELMRTGQGLTGFAWPETYSDFDIRILRDGTWTYQGTPIHRIKMCQLFATVLQRDAEGAYWLVTPGERGRIEVEEAPFTAVEMVAGSNGKGQAVLSFRTNLDYWVTADAEHPIRVVEHPETRAPSPYIEVRDGLEALISRAIFYDMVDRSRVVTQDGTDRLVLDSSGQEFVLGQV